MSQPPSAPRSARDAFGQSMGAGRFGGLVPRPDRDQGRRQRSRLPLKPIVGILSAILLASSALHVWPAIRAGLHDGTRGTWVATTKTCHRSACIWDGKFVAPGGHVLVTSAHYAGHIPTDAHAGTTLPALFTGGSGLVYPVTGSDLWIELVIAILVSVLGLYWSSHRWVAEYLRERRDKPQIAGI
jgi:hypothetical protein